MANHVNTNIEIINLKKETVEKLKERFSGIEIGNSVGDFFDNVEFTHEFFYEHIGAKWCNLEDFDYGDDYVNIMTVSAWSYPERFVSNLNDFILQHQDNFKVFTRYEDEMPNFAGGEVWEDGEMIDCREDDDDEILEGVQYIDPRCHELLMKEQEGELDDEEDEELNDMRWDVMNSVICEIQSFIEDYR